MTNTNEELKKIQIEDDVDRVELFGNMDANLGLIQESTGVEIFQRDDCLLLRGDKLELAEGILKELMDIIRVGEKTGCSEGQLYHQPQGAGSILSREQCKQGYHLFYL